jgi:hypothetical protein
MAVIPKSIRKDVKPGEMEQRQNIARGYRVGPHRDKPATLIDDENTAEKQDEINEHIHKSIDKTYKPHGFYNKSLVEYLRQVYLPVGALGGVISIIAGMPSSFSVIYIAIWGLGYIGLTRL